MTDNFCKSCAVKHGHLWERFSVSRNVVHTSACPKCGSRHVEVEVFEPNLREMRTKKVSESQPPEEGEVPVITITFDREELYVFPEIAFSYYKAPAVKSVSDDVPPALAKDYMEGYLVLRYSPRSAALLARRILQQVLREHGHTQWSLRNQIKSLLKSKELSSISVDSLDAVRNLGDISAHFTQRGDTLLDVEYPEAELCLLVVYELFDHYYVKPAEVARINQKVERQC